LDFNPGGLIRENREVLIVLPATVGSQNTGGDPSPEIFGQLVGKQPHLVKLQLVDSNPNPAITGLNQLPGKINYFLGSTPRQWQTHIPVYAKVKYTGVYPGIDLVFYSNQGDLEFDFIVAPGARADSIKMAIDGAERIQLDGSEDLILSIADQKLRLYKPFIYQDTDIGRQQIPGTYVLDGHHHVRLQIAAYDTQIPLVIDPKLHYSTFLGGEGSDRAYDIALETAAGFVSAVYAAGLTSSGNDFPTTPGAIQSANTNSTDGFVMKLNALGSDMIYATALGGTEGDWINSVTVDDQGYAYVIGTTYSPDFPITPGAYDTACGTDGNCDSTGEGYWLDAFVAKINSAGTALVFSTYLGGINKEFGLGIAVHTLNGESQAYVTGQTLSSDFPILNPVQGTYGEVEHTGGSGDVFVTRFNTAGSGLIFSTYLGGRGPDGGWGIMVDDSGNAFIAGYTTSDNFPATLGAYQSDLQNPVFVRGDGFVARIGEGFVIPPIDLFWQLVIYMTVVALAGLVFFGWRRIFSG
jgi:hypothetical protein